MKIFVDTNILIDFVCSRENFVDDAERLFALGCVENMQLMTSALSYVTAMYVAHKYDYKCVTDTLLAISEFTEVLDLKGRIVVEMLSSDWKDYEDATQYKTAINANADCIVTRNKKDFSNSSLPVYTVSELFETIS